MDPVSQGALGAAVATSARPGRQLARAALLGGLSGMAADLDVLIRSPGDPLLFLEYHRQFSHALLFVPAGALLCALLAYPLVRRRAGFRWVYGCCLLGYASHGVLDACTSYGTRLLWPFSEARIAWNVVSVVDPAFTVPLLVLLGMAVLRRQPVWARVALGWASAYLLLGVLQGWRAEDAARALAAARGHAAQQMLVKPAFGNLLLWKSVYRAQGWYYVDALRAGTAVTFFPGERVAVLDTATDLPWLERDSVQARDLERFWRFSQGYLALDPSVPARVIDVRYSMLPNRVDALWGIELDPRAPQAHARFVTDRAATAAERQALGRMVLRPGLALPEAAQSWW